MSERAIQAAKAVKSHKPFANAPDHESLSEAHARITEELAAIIDKHFPGYDKLPVTADGVVIVPGMRVFRRVALFGQAHSIQVHQCESLRTDLMVNLSECYSTREAAEAALAKTKGTDDA